MKKSIISFIMLLASVTLAAQNKEVVVTGHVTDGATGQPIAGVIVQAYGNNRFTAMTDEDGSYELRVPEHVRSLMMRIDGYNLQQRAIVFQTAKEGDELKGTADARLFSNVFSETYQRSTSAITSAEATHFENSASLSADPLIAQQLGADMRMVGRGGNAGMGNMMLIQGINSLYGNTQPLVVVDGVLLDMQYSREMLHDGYFNNMLANININDIESVQVLKNGTALYGAKGANGVVLINTKRNKSMATKIRCAADSAPAEDDERKRLSSVFDRAAQRMDQPD